jgi:hypothetical protein
MRNIEHFAIAVAATIGLVACMGNNPPSTTAAGISPNPAVATATSATSATTSWRSRFSLNLKKSEGGTACRSTALDYYDFVLTGDHLRMTSNAGSRTDAIVQPDGSVDHSFISSMTGTQLHVTGNVRTKDFLITNAVGCTFESVGQ